MAGLLLTVYKVCDTLSVLAAIVHTQNTVIHLWETKHQNKEPEKKRENGEEGREECGSTGLAFWLPLH